MRVEENSTLFKAVFFCLKVELDYLALLDVSSRYFEVPYSLCHFFGGESEGESLGIPLDRGMLVASGGLASGALG